MEKGTYIFICKISDTGQFFAGRQRDIDLLISQFEVADEDLPFETVAKIMEPDYKLPLGFEERLIQWYDKKMNHEKEELDQAVMAVIQFLQNGFQF